MKNGPNTESRKGTEDGEEGLDGISGSIIGAAIDVHRELGPGLPESAYEACLEYELIARRHKVERQRPLPVIYKGVAIDCKYRMDLVIDDRVAVEVEAVDQLLPVHEAQLLSYLRLSGLSLGLLINFNGVTVKQGIRRLRPFKFFSVPFAPSVVTRS